MASKWKFVYDSEFAHVYDEDFTERVDLQWAGDHVTITVTSDSGVKLNLRGIEDLRKLLQAVERQAKKN
jgi:hypothetical protein